MRLTFRQTHLYRFVQMEVTPRFELGNEVFGAGDEARTRYLDLGKVALYQMSYARR